MHVGTKREQRHTLLSLVWFKGQSSQCLRKIGALSSVNSSLSDHLDFGAGCHSPQDFIYKRAVHLCILQWHSKPCIDTLQCFMPCFFAMCCKNGQCMCQQVSALYVHAHANTPEQHLCILSGETSSLLDPLCTSLGHTKLISCFYKSLKIIGPPGFFFLFFLSRNQSWKKVVYKQQNAFWRVRSGDKTTNRRQLCI